MGYLQEEPPAETRGEKPQPSKDEEKKEEELKEKEPDNAGKEKPNEEVKKDEPKPGNSAPFDAFFILQVHPVQRCSQRVILVNRLGLIRTPTGRFCAVFAFLNVRSSTFSHYFKPRVFTPAAPAPAAPAPAAPAPAAPAPAAANPEGADG